jgi:hypothetical protein
MPRPRRPSSGPLLAPSLQRELDKLERQQARQRYALKTCSVCAGTQPKHDPVSEQRNFNGSVCNACFNARRRARYRFDPHYRLARKRDRQRSYDPEKHRAYMRAYRARKRQQENSS